MQKTALVTGGSKRIGKAICQGLADAGYAVAVHYNTSREPAKSVAMEIVNAGGKAVAVGANLAAEDETSMLLNRAAAALGPVNLLINNASLFEEDTFGEINGELFDLHFNVHVKAPALLASAMAAQQISDGSIVNIIDERVWKLTPNFASYTLSKSTLWTATKTMAQALAPRIRVNAIGPGPTLPSHRQTQADFDDQVKTLLLQRSPELREFTDTILFFERARSVTGQMIALDGGQHLGWQTPDQRAPE